MTPPQSNGMRHTGQFVWGHPQASVVLSKRSMKASRSSFGSILFNRMWVGRARGGGIPPSPNLLDHPAPEQLVVLLLCLDEGPEPMLLILPHVQQRLIVLLMESRERVDDLRKTANLTEMTRWLWSSFFLPGFRHLCSKVQSKEGRGQGW